MSAIAAQLQSAEVQFSKKELRFYCLLKLVLLTKNSFYKNNLNCWFFPFLKLMNRLHLLFIIIQY